MAGFSIGSKELKKVISQIEPVLKGGIDNLPRILFAVNDKVSAKATNGDSYVDIVFDCDVISKGSFVVPGNLLANVVKQTSSEKVELSLDEESKSLYITAGNIKYQLSILEVSEEIFNAPLFDEANTFTMLAQDLKSAIVAVSGCIDSAKPHLNCAMIHTNPDVPNKINIVATDAMRLGIAEREAKYSNDVPNLVVPKKACEYILTMIGDISSEITISYTNNMIKIVLGGITYTSKLLDVAFPKYQAVIPFANDKILETKVSDLKDTIKKVVAAAEMSYTIRMNIDAKSISVVCKDNGNNATGTIDATYSQTEPIEIACNYKFLIEILDVITSSVVRIQIMDGQTPLLIRAVDDDTVKYVFMPFIA
ncbi:MAG: DNA polymerase III subunit beta [Rickettsiales bacterium]|nr:DNA polymerase III subunit beta [Rickettsiales bacterium]